MNPKLHHGTLKAMLLPAVARFSAEVDLIQRERRLQRMVQAMELAGCDVQGDAMVEAIRTMSAALGLPSSLATMGITPDRFEHVIDGAMADHCHKTNPRLATRNDYRAILETSL